MRVPDVLPRGPFLESRPVSLPELPATVCQDKTTTFLTCLAISPSLRVCRQVVALFGCCLAGTVP